MAPNLCRSVRIEKPLSTLGASLNEIRSWLDGHKIEPVGFRSNIADPHTIAIDIAFAQDNEARLFERKFVPERSGARHRQVMISGPTESHVGTEFGLRQQPR